MIDKSDDLVVLLLDGFVLIALFLLWLLGSLGRSIAYSRPSVDAVPRHGDHAAQLTTTSGALLGGGLGGRTGTVILIVDSLLLAC